jgi:hypothetical protein
MLSEYVKHRLAHATNVTVARYGFDWAASKGPVFFIRDVVADAPDEYPPGVHANVVANQREAELFLGGLLGMM